MARIFFSYSHRDESIRDELDTHLGLLKREGLIESWHDRQIEGGDEIDDAVFNKLNESDIILLLISADFINSHYCFDREMARALERHESGEARVIPVIVRPCEWHSAPFGKLKAVPRDGYPISKWADRDEALLDIAREVRRAVQARAGEQVARQTNAVKVSSTGEIELSADDLAEGGVNARAQLMAAYNRLETARITNRESRLVLKSSRYARLLDDSRKIASGELPDDLGETDLAIAKEVERLRTLAAPLEAIAKEPGVNSWLNSSEQRSELALQFIKVLEYPSGKFPGHTSFDMVLRPKSDVSFVFQMPENVVSNLIEKFGFSGVHMMTGTWGFDIYDLPMALILNEILPKLLRLVFHPNAGHLKGEYTDSHLLDLRNWTFGLH